MVVIFAFFLLPFFRKSKKEEMNIENKTIFFIDDGNSLKQKALHQFTFALGGTKGCFF